MKQLLFVCLFAFFASIAFAQNKEAKAQLSKEVEQKFSVAANKAKELVAIKESYNQQIMAYQMPHVEKEMGRATINKNIEDLRKAELAKMTAILQDEKKAGEVSKYLEGRIRLLSQPRIR